MNGDPCSNGMYSRPSCTWNIVPLAFVRTGGNPGPPGLAAVGWRRSPGATLASAPRGSARRSPLVRPGGDAPARSDAIAHFPPRVGGAAPPAPTPPEPIPRAPTPSAAPERAPKVPSGSQPQPAQFPPAGRPTGHGDPDAFPKLLPPTADPPPNSPPGPDLLALPFPVGPRPGLVPPTVLFWGAVEAALRVSPVRHGR